MGEKEKLTAIAEAYQKMTEEQKSYYLGYAEGVSDSHKFAHHTEEQEEPNVTKL